MPKDIAQLLPQQIVNTNSAVEEVQYHNRAIILMKKINYKNKLGERIKIERKKKDILQSSEQTTN